MHRFIQFSSDLARLSVGFASALSGTVPRKSLARLFRSIDLEQPNDEVGQGVEAQNDLCEPAKKRTRSTASCTA